MAKQIVTQPIGGDGGTVVLDIDGDNMELKVTYPLAKVVTPLNTVIDSIIDKVEELIPGDWDKAILEPLRIAAKAELLTLIGQ